MKLQLQFSHLCLLVLSVLAILLITLRPNPQHNPHKLNQVKLVPFHHVSTLARLSAQADIPLKKVRATLVDLFGNIGLFMPFGAASSLFLGGKKRATWSQSLIILGVGLFFSLFIEIVQLWLPSRITDIDDLIFNSSGSLLGAMVIPLGHHGYSRISSFVNSRRASPLAPAPHSI